MNQIDIAIVGGGIVGLSAAIELAAAGRQVTVFDRSHPMHEASTAAAGMLAGNDPENPVELQPLSDLSVRLYPEFLARLEKLSGVHVPIRTAKTIQGGHGLPAGRTALDPAIAQELAPGFAGDPSLNFFLMDEGSLEPGDLLRALPAAARAAGVTILEKHAVTGIRQNSDAVVITTDVGIFFANTIVYAAGAWTGQLTGMPITPRKGQIAMVQEPSIRLRCTLRTPGYYLVPRGDGRIVIGATVEDTGFETTVDEKVHYLMARAGRLWTPLRDCRVLETWAGLRPATPDQLPVIDTWGERGFIAAGHFRNGIMLAPGTARVVCQMILGEKVPIDLTAYNCDRFVTSSVHSS